MLYFSFQNSAPVDPVNYSTETYIKPFENVGETRKYVNDDVPLIPKPPSFEVAVASMHLRETKNRTSSTNSESKCIGAIISQSAILTDTHPKSPSTTKSYTTTTPSISTTISSTASLSSGPLFSLKNSYNDAKIFCQTQSQKEKIGSSEKGRHITCNSADKLLVEKY